MSGRIDFTLDFKARAAKLKRKPDAQYLIYVLGRFSGGNDNTGGLCKIHKVDRDTLEQVMAEMSPHIKIDAGISLNFASLDDFHPDVWLHKVSIIRDLLVLKAELQNPATATQAVAKIQAFLPTETSTKLAESASVVESQDEMLQRLLGKMPETPVAEVDNLEGFIKAIVAPHVSQSIQPQYQQWVDIINTTVSQITRNILHNPAFQRLESLWRGTEALLNEESAEGHSFYLLDMGQAELSAEIKIDPKAFAQIVLQHMRKFDDERNVLLLGDYSFSGNPEDIELMGYCANLAEACHGQFLAAVEQSFLQQLPDVKAQLLTDAGSLMLVYPRYLLRLPYGQKLDPIDTFAFEECSTIPEIQELLWGNSAFLVARAVLRMLDEASGEAQFFDDTPSFSFEMDGEPTLQPGTEFVLSEVQANDLLGHGIMPLIGYRQQRGVRLLGVTCF